MGMTLRDIMALAESKGFEYDQVTLVHDTVGIGSGPIVSAEFDPDSIELSSTNFLLVLKGK